MDWQDGADGFDFQDKLARDDDIRLEAVADFRALIEDGNSGLPGEGNACVCQFSAQAQLIYGFQQSGAGMSVHLDRQPDHPIGQLFRKKHNALLREHRALRTFLRAEHSAAVGRNQTSDDEPRFGTNGAPRGRNQPSGTSRRWQSSKQVFQHREAGRRHGGHGEGQYGASRGVRSGLARSAKFLLLRVLERPPCFSVLKNLLPYFGPAATTQHRWVSAGQREDGCISRGDARRAVLAEAPASQCVIGGFAENPRSPRGFLRLAVQNPRRQIGTRQRQGSTPFPARRHKRRINSLFAARIPD
jgi:hypothetical protein